MGGLELTVLGILGEYLGAVFDEAKRRPLYIVDEVIGRIAQMGVDSYPRFDRRARQYPGAGRQRLYTEDRGPILAERNAYQRGVARRFRSRYRGHNRKRHLPDSLPTV